MSGTLTSDGVGIADQTVKIYAYNSTNNSSTLVNTTTTNSTGGYSAYWTVTWILYGIQISHLYAEFDETTNYNSSKSDEISVGSITGGTIIPILSLSASKTNATVGELIIFTGQITTTNPHVTVDFSSDDSFNLALFGCATSCDSSSSLTLVANIPIMNSSGDFSASWNATAGVGEVYIRFGGGSGAAGPVVGATFMGSDSSRISLSINEDSPIPVTTTLNVSTTFTQVEVGQQITFEGRLFDSSTGGGLVGETIGLYELCPGCNAGNSSLMSTTTGSLGAFNFTWTAQSEYLNHCKDGISNPCTIELFARFSGYTNSSNYVFATNYSPLVDVILTPIAVVDCSTIHCSTSLTLQAIWSSGFFLSNDPSHSDTVEKGDVITFSGKLNHSDQGISGKTIVIYDYDSDNNNATLVNTVTLADGSFSVEWVAECKDPGETPCIMELFAQFVGNASHPNPGYSSSSTATNSTSPFYSLTVDEKFSTHFQFMSLSHDQFDMQEGDLVKISVVLRRTFDSSPLSNMNVEFIALQSDSQAFSIGINSTDSDGFTTMNWFATSNITTIRVEFTGNSSYYDSSIAMSVLVQEVVCPAGQVAGQAVENGICPEPEPEPEPVPEPEPEPEQEPEPEPEQEPEPEPESTEETEYYCLFN